VSRTKKDPLRPLTSSERRSLEQLARSQSAPALSVARARAFLAVSDGASYSDAALLVGRALGDSVAVWVARFNQVGLAAVERQAGGCPPTQYGPEERDRILLEFRRPPDREEDGTATWSLNTLQRAPRRAPDGLPKVSTYTIWAVLHDAGISWQRDRTWCETGVAIRKRKRGEVKVHDPDASAKKGCSSRPTPRANAWVWLCGAPTKPVRTRPFLSPACTGSPSVGLLDIPMNTFVMALPSC
jgi:transposase